MRSIPLTAEPELTTAERLRLALDLAEAGVDLMRARLEREHPDADAAEIRRLLLAWLQTRPGAEHGDAEGVPAPHRFEAP